VNVWGANFQELYRRHLCRHSQLGNNVIHLVAVAGIYLALCGVLVGLAHSWWILAAVAVPYLAVLAFNVPLRVFVLLVAILAALFAALFALPAVSWWWYLLAVPVLYKVQALGHKLYDKERDMTEFNQKYHKGFALFVLLSVYELPILLNYLFFGKRDWCA
jgi:hypothetical protein